MNQPALLPSTGTEAPRPGSAGVRPASDAAGDEVVLDVRDVGKRYRKLALLRRKRSASEVEVALEGISFQLRRGETLGLLGPNGAGKTTLLKVMTTLIYPTSGSVRLFGRDVAQHSRWARSVMGLVTCDERSFYWRLTGWQNLEFFGTLYGIPPATLEARSTELLDALGLLHAAHRPYQDYSSGMKQKMAIARGLLGDPDLVLYDEPTRSLDPVSVQGIRGWIERKKLASPGQSHVIATNQLSEAEQLCDRVLILKKGRIAALGTPSEIRERFHADDSQSHRMLVRPGPVPVDSALVPNASAGLLDVAVSSGGPEGERVRIRTRKGSEGLTRALAALLESGATVLRCDLEEASFDEIFCSLILDGDGEGEVA